jgi:hypothetical protein
MINIESSSSKVKFKYKNNFQRLNGFAIDTSQDYCH